MAEKNRTVRVEDEATVDLVNRMVEREGELTATVILRRAIRQYAAANHADLIPSLIPSPAPSQVAAPAPVQQ